MTETERKQIIENIQKEIKDKKSLQKKYERLQELKNDPKVIEYINFVEIITRIEKDLNKYKNPINAILMTL